MMLPAELIDHIFSFLQKDILALKACSKAHPLFLILAERHLYAHIVIDPQAPETHDLILENPRLLDYPRTLQIRCHDYTSSRNPMAIVPMIPQMSNLISLRIDTLPCPFYYREEFFSTFKTILQQLQPSLQQLFIFSFFDFPLSVLDVAKSIKQLTLSYCTADKQESISSSPSSHLSLETLILSGDHNPELHRWAMRWVTRLTTLELQDPMPNRDWTVFPELLVACSNSLTWLSLHFFFTNTIPFTLSALMHLKRISIFALLFPTAPWTLPEFIRVVNTAPAIHDVVLRFYFISDSIISLALLDWSILDQLRPNLTGKRPRVNLCVNSCTMGTIVCPESILGDLAANEELMDLVERGLVVLGSDGQSPFHGSL